VEPKSKGIWNFSIHSGFTTNNGDLRFFVQEIEEIGLKHNLADGESKVHYSSEAARRFQGYLTTDEEDALYKKYARHSSMEVFM